MNQSPQQPTQQPSSIHLIDRLANPIERFIRSAASGGGVLMLSACIALAWANSPYSHLYVDLWETSIAVSVGNTALSKSLLHWINDGLMAMFFVVVGLEIKREMLVGELSSVKKASLSVIAAFGGMVVPALLYSLLNSNSAGSAGWGIPMATDIAFALGVVSLLGNRVPFALKVFLTALAIADDIGAVVVIALFYTSQLNLAMLFWAVGITILLVIANRIGVRNLFFYAFAGVALWWCVMQSGIHATIAGVVLAMTIPARQRINAEEFTDDARALVAEFAEQTHEGTHILANQNAQSAVRALEQSCEHVQTPLSRFEGALHLPVALIVMPLFAFANAGVALSGNLSEAFSNRVTLGIILGLVVGKPIGITLFCWLGARLKIATIPNGVTWSTLFAIGCLGGIGFTMSLFVQSLAFNDAVLSTDAKIGIFTASAVSGLVGSLLLMLVRRKPRRS